jgi:CDP-glucose 4,6-dehydratase
MKLVPSTFWHGKRVLVTGANGLLGPWLIKDLLACGASVVALVRDLMPQSLFHTTGQEQQITVCFGQLEDLDVLLRIINEQNIDTVFHLGAQAIVGYANRSPISTFTANITGTWNLLEACRLSPWVKRIIIASSDKAYGEHAVLPYNEEAPLQGRHPYDVSKSCADLLAQSYVATYNLPVCITRCGNFFGGGDAHLNRIVPGTITALLANQSPIIRSNGLFVRDYIYVKDVADAYRTLAEQMDNPAIVGQAFNFSTDLPFTTLELVEKIAMLMGKEALKPTILNQASNEIPAQHLCSAKAKRLLNWQAKYGVEAGLAETIAWYQQQSKQFMPPLDKMQSQARI